MSSASSITLSSSGSDTTVEDSDSLLVTFVDQWRWIALSGLLFSSVAYFFCGLIISRVLRKPLFAVWLPFTLGLFGGIYSFAVIAPAGKVNCSSKLF